MKKSERAKFLTGLVMPSVEAAFEAGHSLALIRPQNPKFRIKSKTAVQIEREREAYRQSAAQTSMFDEELAAIEPTPYEFRFKFEDDDASHDFANGDWEAHAMFWRGRKLQQTDQETLDWIRTTFDEEYPKKGMLFAVGNQAKRPHVWQLLGVLRVDDYGQDSLSF